MFYFIYFFKVVAFPREAVYASKRNGNFSQFREIHSISSLSSTSVLETLSRGFLNRCHWRRSGLHLSLFIMMHLPMDFVSSQYWETTALPTLQLRTGYSGTTVSDWSVSDTLRDQSVRSRHSSGLFCLTLVPPSPHANQGPLKNFTVPRPDLLTGNASHTMQILKPSRSFRSPRI